MGPNPDAAAFADRQTGHTMLAQASPPILDVEADLDVVAWRLAQLRRAGYTEAAATDLSARADVDLHVAEDLLRAGCPVALALEILR